MSFHQTVRMPTTAEIDATEAQDLTDEMIYQRYGDDVDHIWAGILSYAVENLPRDLALEVLCSEIDGLGGMPLSAIGSTMEQARLWVKWATPPERRAYIAACYDALSPAEKAAFRDYADRRAAA